MKREIKIDNSHIITIENGIVSVPAFGDIWKTQHQLADLLGCFLSKINANIRAILKSEVLFESDVCKTCYCQNGHSVGLYGLGIIIAISFHIKSTNAGLFRNWIIEQLAQRPYKQIIMLFSRKSNLHYN